MSHGESNPREQAVLAVCIYFILFFLNPHCANFSHKTEETHFWQNILPRFKKTAGTLDNWTFKLELGDWKEH